MGVLSTQVGTALFWVDIPSSVARFTSVWFLQLLDALVNVAVGRSAARRSMMHWQVPGWISNQLRSYQRWMNHLFASCLQPVIYHCWTSWFDLAQDLSGFTETRYLNEALVISSTDYRTWQSWSSAFFWLCQQWSSLPRLTSLWRPWRKSWIFKTWSTQVMGS